MCDKININNFNGYKSASRMHGLDPVSISSNAEDTLKNEDSENSRAYNSGITNRWDQAKKRPRNLREDQVEDTTPKA